MMTADGICGFVLAGGRSARMGTDKALVDFAGAPLIRNARNILERAGIPGRIAGSRSDLSEFGEEVPDRFSDSGPLGGVHAALAQSVARWNVFVPVDMPLLPASLVAALVERAVVTEAPVTVTTLCGALQPFPVVLNRAVLSFVEERLNSGSSACYRAWQSIPGELGCRLDSVSVESLQQCGGCSHAAGLPPPFWFQGTNSPLELERLERIFLARAAEGVGNNDENFE